MNQNQFDELEDVLTEDITGVGQQSHIIVYNDDFNTFDWVIQCFMEVCNHTQEQSEQLSLLIHFKGKATVKTGPLDTLKPMKDALVDRGLSAVIETLVED
ncbi:MAG: ATP-dependent Clp protease adaptor ClpS [Saprospiraceae bacterium]|nr:ATP-dependent Clp protease adaptor ClpS [Saprospiraceae bacterium]